MSPEEATGAEAQRTIMPGLLQGGMFIPPYGCGVTPKEEPYSGDHIDNVEEHEHTSAQDSGAASGVYLSRGHIPRRS